MLEPREVFKFSKENVAITTEGTELTWRVPADLPYFDGHFPGQPVLPGVAILDASVVAIESVTNRQLSLQVVSSAKFTGLVEPGAIVKITLKEQEPRNWEIQWLSTDPLVEKKSLAKIQCVLG